MSFEVKTIQVVWQDSKPDHKLLGLVRQDVGPSELLGQWWADHGTPGWQGLSSHLVLVEPQCFVSLPEVVVCCCKLEKSNALL